MAQRPVSSPAPRRRTGPVAKLHEALFRIAAMRAAVAELAPPDAESFMARLELAESLALGLLDDVERRTKAVAH